MLFRFQRLFPADVEGIGHDSFLTATVISFAVVHFLKDDGMIVSSDTNTFMSATSQGVDILMIKQFGCCLYSNFSYVTQRRASRVSEGIFLERGVEERLLKYLMTKPSTFIGFPFKM